VNTDGLVVINPLLSVSRSQYVQDLVRSAIPSSLSATVKDSRQSLPINAGGISQGHQHLMPMDIKVLLISRECGDPNGDSGERLEAYQACSSDMG